MAGRPRLTSDEQILDAALRVIGAHGPHKATLALVAEEAGVAPPTLVQRFGGKRGLLLAVAARGAADVERVFQRAREAEDEPLAALHRALAVLVRDLDDPARMANHVAFLQMDLQDEDLRAHATRHARIAVRRIGALLEEAAGRGDLDVDDPAALSSLVHTAFSGAIVTWPLVGKGRLPSWVRRQVDAVLAPHRRAPPARARR